MREDKLTAVLRQVNTFKGGLAAELRKELDPGEDRPVLSTPDKYEADRSLFQSDKKPRAALRPIAQEDQVAPVEELRGFIQSLGSIGVHYRGNNQKRKDAIKRIEDLVKNEAPKEGASNKEVIVFAKKVREVLADVTKDHHKGFKGFLAYLFGKKSRLEQLISNCFKPLVNVGLFRQAKAGVEPVALGSQRSIASSRLANL